VAKAVTPPVPTEQKTSLSGSLQVRMTDDDLKILSAAVRVLEHPGLVARLGSMVGKPIDLIRQALPAGATQAIAAATTKALDAALAVALRSIRNNPRAGSRLLHKVMATASGAVGGSVGLVALPIELPISTIIMLRSIAEIARSEGEDLADPETALACIEVFALGGRAGGDDAADSGYFAVRGVLAKSVSEAARFIAERGIVSEGAPLLAAFIAQVASRFGVVVTQKLAAQILPVVGALGGATVNYAFIDHFQEVARAHFTVRRLERTYGKDVVHVAYERLRDGTNPTSAEEQVRSVHGLEGSIAGTKDFP
jgi:EcsC protein family